MAEAATFQNDTIAQDQEEQARAREFRQEQARIARSRARTDAAGGAGSLSGIAQSEQLAEIVERARKFRNVLSMIELSSALSIVASPWALLSGNVRTLITVFGPPKNPFAIPMWHVAIVLIADLLVGILLIAVIAIGYALANPVAASCTFAQTIFGDHWWTTLFQTACKTFGVT